MFLAYDGVAYSDSGDDLFFSSAWFLILVFLSLILVNASEHSQYI